MVILGSALSRLLRLVLTLGSRVLFLGSVVALAWGSGTLPSRSVSCLRWRVRGGLILSESEFSHQALSDVVPVRKSSGCVLRFVGMLSIRGTCWRMRAACAVVVLIWWESRDHRRAGAGVRVRVHGALIVGLGLSQVGEFAVVWRGAASAPGRSPNDYDWR